MCCKNEITKPIKGSLFSALLAELLLFSSADNCYPPNCIVFSVICNLTCAPFNTSCLLDGHVPNPDRIQVLKCNHIFMMYFAVQMHFQLFKIRSCSDRKMLTLILVWNYEGVFINFWGRPC